MKSNHIVFTTIYEPVVLSDLRENLHRYGHLDDTLVWVIGDHKTPPECAALCHQADQMGMETHYLDIATQDVWGAAHPDLYRRIPYNNETRRNIGYLKALENGCERLISIDDDNFPLENDFILGHMQTGSSWDADVIRSNNRFYNICEHLTFNNGSAIFPRGYPFELRRGLNDYQLTRPHNSSLIGVTAGLWLRDPDVDATTWLNHAPQASAYNGPDLFVLDQDTWSPINTQNTSVIRELIPAFLCIPMGFPVPGGRIERYGDIWGGYFLQAVMAGTPYHAAFGMPIVEHRRNPHNYLDDLRHEYWGMILTDWLLHHLRSDFKPVDRQISARVEHLAEFVQQISATHLPTWCPPEVAVFLQETAATLKCWAATCRTILSE